ncbi:PEBP-like protein [Gloeopeniophorella convolvens]|nr:PEBP-like protein [Gloeopeniophorella convolvens]
MLGALSLLALLLPAALVHAAPQADPSTAAVRAIFEAFHIPEDAHLTFAPTTLLGLTFPEPGAAPVVPFTSEQLPRNATAGPPRFALSDAHASVGRGPFVVAAVDLDAPTPQDPTSAQIRHFLGGDFVLHTGGALANTTPALTEFHQPTPPAGSDPHRYVFLVFKQPPGFAQQTLVNASTSIANFNISSFAEATGLGQPLGGTFIRVGPDPSS